MEREQLPSFVVIGAMKAGTSSLHSYLDLHPEISMPYTRKELDFFNENRNWAKGVEWYKSNFRKNNLIKGEVSPNYAMYPAPGADQAPRRMKSIIPDARLIYILRDPVERMLSQIHHQMVDGRETRTIDEIVGDDSDKWNYRNYSKYYFQLEQFLPYYSRDNILIVTLEDLNRDPKGVMSEVFSFLGVDPHYYHESFCRVSHSSSEKRVPGSFQRFLDGIALLRPLQKLVRIILKCIPKRIAERFKLVTGVQVPKPLLTPAQQASLVEVFREDVAKLRKFCGRDFGEWKKSY